MGISTDFGHAKFLEQARKEQPRFSFQLVYISRERFLMNKTPNMFHVKQFFAKEKLKIYTPLQSCFMQNIFANGKLTGIFKKKVNYVLYETNFYKGKSDKYIKNKFCCVPHETILLIHKMFKTC